VRIALATDAWAPQTNGVVTTLTATAATLELLGHEVRVISPQGLPSLACPSYPELRLAISPGAHVARELRAFHPHAIHIATEGPLGLAVRRYCRARRVPFTTSYHTRYPEYLRARWPIPLWRRGVDLRRFRATKLIIGDGPQRAALTARYPDAVFAGYRFGAELPALLSGADVLVFPSLTDTFGLVMIEALACGVPVAAFPVPGPLDVIAQDVTGVLHADLRVAITSALRLERSVCATAAAAFSWDAATGQFLTGLAPIPVALRATLATSRTSAMIARIAARRQTSQAGDAN
jgi:glycosyltransferase involved in cell wall biosynthesis